MKDKYLKYLLILPAALLVLGTALLPLLDAFITSFHDWRLTKSIVRGAFVGLDNYHMASTDSPEFKESAWVTFLFVVFDVALTVIFAFGLALLLRKAGFLSSITRAILLIPFAVSPALVGISFRFMFNAEFGVFAHLFAPFVNRADWIAHPVLALAVLIFSDIWRWVPYMTLVVLGGLAALPSEPEEAARVDGAREWQVVRDVLLPQIAPVLAVVAILKTIFSLKMFDQVVTLTGGGPGSPTQTLSFLIYNVAFKWYDLGFAAALSYILSGLTIIMAVFYLHFVLKKRQV